MRRRPDGANLREVVEEEYVRRNASRQEVEHILEKPELVEDRSPTASSTTALSLDIDPDKEAPASATSKGT